jgi:4-aminobutyrate aminotransferase-like enzyme
MTPSDFSSREDVAHGEAIDTTNHLFRRLESNGTKTFSLAEEPPVFKSGENARLISTDDRQYIDMATGSAVSVLGHNHPRVHAALEAQLATGITHIGPHFHTVSQADLFGRLERLLPESLCRLHPATNGTEASEVALKAAMFRTGARHFASFWGSYHGRTMGALAVSTARGANRQNGPFLPAAQFLPYPDCANCTLDRGEGCCGKFEDMVFEALTRGYSGAGPLAGVIIEPIQGTAGMRFPPKSFINVVAAAAREAGVPLIFDEIFTGFGRTGRMFAFEHYDVVPDMLVLAKAVGGGIPAGVVAARPGFLEDWAPGTQSSTFQIHPMAAAAGAALIDTVMEDDLCARARDIESWIAERRDELLAFPVVSDVRGRGAMHGVEIMSNGKPDKKLCDAIRRKALELGLITYESGVGGNVIGLLPPLTIPRDDLERGVDILIASIRSQVS